MNPAGPGDRTDRPLFTTPQKRILFAVCASPQGETVRFRKQGANVMRDPSKARLAISHLAGGVIPTSKINQEIFTCAMKEADLPFLAITLEGLVASINLEAPAEIVLFEDGSGFFADSYEAGAWAPWPLDAIDDPEGELLPVWPDAGKLLPFSEPFRFIKQADVISEAFTDHLRICARHHENPPEALHNLLVEPERDLTWTNSDRVEDVLAMLSILARALCPAATEIVVFANSTPGRTHVQKTNDASMIEFLKELDSRLSEDPAMELHYQGFAYAEISEAEVLYEEQSRANRYFAPISHVLLDRVASPIGWETNYNDGPINRLSGYNATGRSIVLDLVSWSAHERLSARQEFFDFLKGEGLVDPLRPLLDLSGAFPDLGV